METQNNSPVNLPMLSTKNIHMFSTYPYPCGYRPNYEATSLFIDPGVEVNASLHALLSVAGFRRSGKYFYRPHCRNCQSCVAARIPVQDFPLKRRYRRILRKNADLQAVQLESIQDDEYYLLYKNYICARHRDGEMYPPSRKQYEDFLIDGSGHTEYYAFRTRRRLLAVAVLDCLPNGLAAVYTFFAGDAEEAHRSLGNYVILWQVEKARRMNLPAVYLGYWIRQCRKMDYKIAFRPIELLSNGQWRRLH